MAGKPINIQEQVIIGANRYGYVFAVGRVDDRWLGYAIGRLDEKVELDLPANMLFLLPGIGDGHHMGVLDRTEAIRRTSAIALTDLSYGGIDDWYIDQEMRGDPERYRCGVCGEVCCEVDHTDPGDDWMPDEIDENGAH